MKLFLIRHGSPDYKNDTLTQKGHEQACLLAEALLNVPIDTIYVSPRGRAQETAEYTLRRKKQKGIMLDWLTELSCPFRDRLYPYRMLEPWSMQAVEVFDRSDNFTIRNWHKKIVYGQRMKIVAENFYEKFESFMKEQGYELEGFRYKLITRKEENIAFFCHAGLIFTLLSHVLHIPLPVVYAQFKCSQASVTTIKMDVGNGYGVFRLECLNNISHLPCYMQE